ncbi:S8 family peptidase [Actinoallomurus spadix]|uniref:S8 family peptidase n=1 Tax=Actinoallomurus spadix TaxID=79912 RepID=A0ABP3H301_9ACTN|nr:S8 family peptidase [Actinoallomurus spadix]MCO5987807.1 S8 family peptidase [Actinoallomurus spadix]
MIASSVVALGAAAVPAYAAITGPAPHVAVVSASVSADAVPGQYIVTLKRAGARSSKLSGFHRIHDYGDGFAAKLTPAQLRKVQTDPNVAAIEQDKIVKIQGTTPTPTPSATPTTAPPTTPPTTPTPPTKTTQKNPNWGPDRIDQHKLPLSHSYTYTHTGKGVDAYVIDTGIDTTLSQFGGRADSVYGGKGDCEGHGTHVAGIIGSRTYGVAKEVKLHAVKVLGCNGQGKISDVIAGINWVTKHHASKSVANLSLGGDKSTALNSAVTKLSKSGVFVAVAAGNDSADSCKSSPASAASVEAVAASTSTDKRASFSNYGKCVDIYAPGNNIKSTVPGGTEFESGTSMASPFVAGVAALYKSTYGQKSFGTVQSWIHAHATNNVIQKNKSNTHNRLLYKSTL